MTCGHMKQARKHEYFKFKAHGELEQQWHAETDAQISGTASVKAETGYKLTQPHVETEKLDA